MANFKRKRSRRQVKCTMCTPVRWLGNSKERLKFRDRRERDRSDPADA
jgi:hypothetical protein